MTCRQVVLVLLFLGSVVITWGENPRPSIGIAPVYDGSGAAFGETFAQHLTQFIYQELLTSHAVHPVLLSPGGVYSPLDLSWLVDYVHDQPDVSLLLVATLKPVSNLEKNRWLIPVDLLIVSSSTGESLATWTDSFEINSKKTLTEYGSFDFGPSSIDKYGQVHQSYAIAPSRAFEKQPLGKACARLATTIKGSLEGKLAGTETGGMSPTDLAASSSAPTNTNQGFCPIRIRITYGYKHSASQSYMLLANGLEQSTNLKDGIASFTAPEGELLLQFSMNDAPYKMETERFYQMSTWHSCKATNLMVDVGPSGDAHPHWE
jgi:hypothetical protein